MKALRVSAPGEVSVADVPDPTPVDGEVLVRVERAALCATDRKIIQRGVACPLVLGHEGAGRLADGTPVGIHPDVGCGRCRHCRQGLETRCPDKRSLGVRRDGALAERVAVRRDHVVPLAGLELALAPLLEPLACCLHAVTLLAPAPGTPALVVGGGVMGILNLWALRASGCPVLLVEPNEERRELALELGADAVTAPDVPVAEALGCVPQFAVVTVPSAEALASSLEQVDIGGAVHAFASIQGAAAVDANLVHSRHLRLVGSTGSDLDDYERARTLVASARVPIHRLPVTEIPLEKAPDQLRDGTGSETLKTIVDVRGEE
ncbi:MAG: alcohol dehydrogenase catalytic domain-containing protein [Streptosporangiaceae bacterium]